MATDETNTTISFRLPEVLHTRLVKQAEDAGITKHQLARTLILQALEGGEREELAAALASLEGSVTALRGALGRGVGAILQNVSKVDKETIRRWVFEKMLTDQLAEGVPEGNP